MDCWRKALHQPRLGHCSVFTCHLREFFFIDTELTWHKAQEYCRHKHSDLLTVYDMEDLRILEDSKIPKKDAWIGLERGSVDGNSWKWSQPGVNKKTLWAKGQPDDREGRTENCAMITDNGLNDFECENKLTFLCYNDTTKKVELVTDKKNWWDALKHCRTLHTDLASETDQLNRKDKEYHWTGYFRDGWRWSDGSDSSFRNWQSNDDNKKNCTSFRVNSGEWKPQRCTEKKPFICYEDNTILVTENRTWEESLTSCRERYNELVSITSREDQKWMQIKVKKATSPFVWLGLRYTCTLEFWFWVSDEAVNYDNFDKDGKENKCDMSGALERGGQQKWRSRSDTEQFNFMCSKSEKSPSGAS